MQSRRPGALAAITEYYLESGDFNGLSLAVLSEHLQLTLEDTVREVRPLVSEGSCAVLAPEHDVNSHILRLGFAGTEKQLRHLEAPDPHHTCVYPTPQRLREVVDPAQFQGRPYELALALGSPQLSFRSFDLGILETYRNDPRYVYETNDLVGSISISDDYYESEEMPERDQVLLQNFGYSYNEREDRAVAVYVRYLADLTPEHQSIWKAKELVGDYKLHPDFFRTTILGEWPERVPVIDAILEEMALVNEMAAAMGRPHLFRETYEHRRPSGLGLLVRPTLKEFSDFVLLMDKLLSDNLEKSFFRGDVPDTEEHVRKDGRIEIRRVGTIAMLEAWLTDNFRPADPAPIKEALSALRAIRRLRQRPAHAIDDNVFDQEYVHRQRDVLRKAYVAVRTLRMVFENHPRARGIAVPDHLRYGKVWHM